jgi:hypothetical protein
MHEDFHFRMSFKMLNNQGGPAMSGFVRIQVQIGSFFQLDSFKTHSVSLLYNAHCQHLVWGTNTTSYRAASASGESLIDIPCKIDATLGAA